MIFPLPQAPPQTTGLACRTTSDRPTPPTTPVAPYYFLTIGNPLPAGAEANPFAPTYTLNAHVGPCQLPRTPTGSVLPPAGVRAAARPYGGTVPVTYPNKISTAPSFPGPGAGNGAMFWVCLRRPANPFAPVSAANPMIVVDAMRFPVIEGGGTAGSPPSLANANQHFLVPAAPAVPGRTRGAHARRDRRTRSALRLQRADRRADHADHRPWASPAGSQITEPADSTTPLACPTTARVNLGSAGPPVVPPYLNEPWDYFPFNDRDFTSVAELLMVPGCPPGLFTKQFAEFAPSSANVTNIFSQVTPLPSPLTHTQLADRAAGRLAPQRPPRIRSTPAASHRPR